MGIIWIKEFTGGLDTRRMSEASAGGILNRARNGHITSGGEFEARYAFVPEYTLPAGTHGLFYDRSGIVVFGHQTEPTMPPGVSYQQIEHPDETTALTRVLSADLYQGRVYVVGEFADGSIHHFYNGERVEDWFDGRARAAFDVTGGSVTPATAATGSFEITAGTNDPSNTIGTVIIGGVNILGSAVQHTGNNDTTASAVAAQINSHTSTPDYTATAAGPVVTVTAVATGPGVNGLAILVSTSGDATVDNETNMTGGANASISTLNDITVGGVSIINAPVQWADSNTDTAAAIASAINGFTSIPEYTATSVGTRVNIIVDEPGSAGNGRAVEFTTTNGFAVTPSTGLETATGDDSETGYQPGSYVKTIGAKMYSVSGPNMHFSGIKEPTEWTTDAVGAGFIDMSSENSGSEQLVSLARYQEFVAVFAERVVQIWFVDPDPALYRSVQTLSNTGTASRHSVTQFGDNDIFYLDESGLRSLQARDSSNAAATTDIGSPIDTLIRAQLATLDDIERDNIAGLIEPKTGRFWLVMKNQIFVFSFFPGPRVSAWSTYETTDDEGNPFDVDATTVFNRRVYLRSGDTIYVYGGLSGDVYDETQAEAWLPYLDANDPSRLKEWNGIDAAVLGEWEVFAAMQPTEDTVEDQIATIWETTYNRNRIAMQHRASHISLRFRSKGTGERRLAAVLVNYDGHADDD